MGIAAFQADAGGLRSMGCGLGIQAPRRRTRSSCRQPRDAGRAGKFRVGSEWKSMLNSKPKIAKRKLWPKTLPTVPKSKALACVLDRMADIELQHGHHHRAEQFALRAAELQRARS
jgi:hypothetical protein